MPIPDFQTIMLPLLKFASDGKEHSGEEALEVMCNHFKLTESERNETYPSGKDVPIIYDRVHWARTDLKNAVLLKQPRRGYFQITERGQNVLKEKPSKIDRNYLKKFPEFVDYLKRTRVDKKEKLETEFTKTETIRESLDKSYEALKQNLAYQVLEEIKERPPEFLEKVVLDLLREMGYGGKVKDSGMITGKSGDGGIDGIIMQDHLGLDKVCYQAKKWNNTVHPDKVRDFAGALAKITNKGVFVTTSTFSDDCYIYVKDHPTKIVLIDGEKLANLMIEHGIGVSLKDTYKIMELDSDYYIPSES